MSHNLLQVEASVNRFDYTVNTAGKRTRIAIPTPNADHMTLYKLTQSIIGDGQTVTAAFASRVAVMVSLQLFTELSLTSPSSAIGLHEG